MGQKNRIWVKVLVGFLVALILLIGTALFFANQFVAQTQTIATAMYGAPLPQAIKPLLGFDLKPRHLVVLTHTEEQWIAILETSPSKAEGLALTPLNLKQALESYQQSEALKPILSGFSLERPSTIALGKTTVAALTTPPDSKQTGLCTILNLPHQQLFVLFTGNNLGHLQLAASQFFSHMPKLKSHLATSP